MWDFDEYLAAFAALMIVVAVPVFVFGQSPGSAAGNATPVIVLPHELALEEQLQLRTDERNFVLDENDRLKLQVQQLQAIVGQVLEGMRQERTAQASASRGEISKKLIQLLGGDPAKDTWDWAKRGLLKADGTFVALEAK
jgi:hypothetical protein